MLETLATLRQGGWIMFPLLICSLVGLTIVIERILALRRRNVIDPDVIELVEKFGRGTKAEDAILVCRRGKGPFAKLIGEILKARHLDHTQVVETMHATGRTQVGTLERGLTVLEIVAAISPLLGLLGTVLGMVTVFNAITVRGLGNPQVLADGISKALVTTVAGLCIAIPALAFHSWLTRRVDDYATEMHDRATGLIVKMYGARQTPTTAPRGEL